MTEWDGKCSVCGVQIQGNPEEELNYDLGEPGCPAYCDKCWDEQESIRRAEALSNPVLWLMIIALILLIIHGVMR